MDADEHVAELLAKDPTAVGLDEVLAHLSPNGQLEFSLATERARNAKLTKLLEEAKKAPENVDDISDVKGD